MFADCKIFRRCPEALAPFGAAEQEPPHALFETPRGRAALGMTAEDVPMDSASRCVAAEVAMPSGARGKSPRAGEGFAGCDHLEAAAHLVGDCRLFVEVPLPQRGQAVGAHAGLRKRGDLLCQYD